MSTRYRHWRNVAQPGETVFVTTTVLGFVPLFARSEPARTMLRILAETCRHYGCRLHGYVIMPEHIHLLLRLPEGLGIAKFMHSLKRRTACRLLPLCAGAEIVHMQQAARYRAFWQEFLPSVPVSSEEDALVKLRYIHGNPVKRGFVDEETAYAFSSAKLFAEGLWDEGDGLPPAELLCDPEE